MQSKIPTLLAKSGMSVNALSKATGLSRTTLTPLSKSTTIPTQTRIETLELVATALEVSIFDLFDRPSSRIVRSEVFEILNQVQVGLTDREMASYPQTHIHTKTVSAGLIRTYTQTNRTPLWFAYYLDTLGSMFVDILVSYDCMLLSLPNNTKWVLPQNEFSANMRCLNRDKSFMEQLNPTMLDSYLRQIVQIKKIQEISKAMLPKVVNVSDKPEIGPPLGPAIQASIAFEFDSLITLSDDKRPVAEEPKRIGIGLNNTVVSFIASYFNSQRSLDD